MANQAERNPVIEMMTQVRGSILKKLYAGELNYVGDMKTLTRQVDMATQLENDELRARTLSVMGIIEWYRGSYQDAYAHFSDAMTAFEAYENFSAMATSLMNLGEVHRLWGNVEAAAQCYDGAMKMADPNEQQNLIINILTNEGQLWVENGQPDRGIELLTQSLSMMEGKQWEGDNTIHILCEIKSSLAQGYGIKHDLKAAEAHADSALSLSQEYFQVPEVARSYQTMALIAINNPKSKYKIDDCFAASRENWTKAEAMGDLGRMLMLEADYLQSIGKSQQATAIYKEALKAFEKSQIPGMIEKVKALLQQRDSDEQNSSNAVGA